jgi:hypothetical protein
MCAMTNRTARILATLALGCCAHVGSARGAREVWVERADAYLSVLEPMFVSAPPNDLSRASEALDAMAAARASLAAAAPPGPSEIRSLLATGGQARRQALALVSVITMRPADVIAEALRDASRDDLLARLLVAWIAAELGDADVERHADELVRRFEREQDAGVVAAALPAIEKLDERRRSVLLAGIAAGGLPRVATAIAAGERGGIDRLLARLRETGATDVERIVDGYRRDPDSVLKHE